MVTALLVFSEKKLGNLYLAISSLSIQININNLNLIQVDIQVDIISYHITALRTYKENKVSTNHVRVRERMFLQTYSLQFVLTQALNTLDNLRLCLF